MSHFAVLVIGEDVEEQLKKYDENLEFPEYDDGEVDEDEINRFIDYYTKDIDIPKDEIPSMDELYKKYGDDWNHNAWKKNEDGTWHEYSTYNTNSKWD